MRGGFRNVAPNKSEEARTAPRDRNVGPRLSGRREEGGGGGGAGGGDFPSRSSRGARTGERARGGNRGSRRGREFDRHSASGKYDSEKKETQAWGDPINNWEKSNEGTGGGGVEVTNWDSSETKKGGWTTGEAESTPSNWNDNGGETAETAQTGWKGTDQPPEPSNWEQEAQNEGQVNAGASNWNEESTAPAAEWDGGPQVEDTGAAQSPPPVAEEVVKTLDEYLAEKAQKSLDISLPEVRRPNEGADDSQWKDAVPLQKEDDEDFLFTGKEQSIKLKAKRASKVAKNVIEIDQTFSERPGGGYQRSRGRGRRGGRGRDGGTDNFRERRDYDRRDSRDHESRRGGRGVVNLDDATAFPSLGSA